MSLLTVTSVQPSQWPALHRMMLLQNFPGVPENFEEAEPYLEQADIYGLFNDGRLKAAFLLVNKTEEAAFMDILCLPDWEGRWGTRANLRAMGNVVFSQLGLRYVCSESYNSKALKAAVKAGFVTASPLEDGWPVLSILTKRAFNERFKFNKTGE